MITRSRTNGTLRRVTTNDEHDFAILNGTKRLPRHGTQLC